jgi:thiol-disulfide isomerase/thioredoxin
MWKYIQATIYYRTRSRMNLAKSASVMLIMVALMLASTSCAGVSEVGGVVPSGQGDQLPAAPRPGHPAPEIILLDLKGTPVKLSAFRGKPVVINFWATWCPPCRAEMPDIETVWQRHKDKGLVIIGVDVGEDPETVSKYVEKGGFTWLFILDSGGEVFRDLYKGAAFPSSFFVDSQGVIQDLSIGALNEKGFESKIAKILPSASQ